MVEHVYGAQTMNVDTTGAKKRLGGGLDFQLETMISRSGRRCTDVGQPYQSAMRDAERPDTGSQSSSSERLRHAPEDEQREGER